MAGANVIDYIAVRFEALRGEIASLRRELRLAFILLTATFGFVGVQFPLMYWQGRELGVLSGGQNALIEDVSELKQGQATLNEEVVGLKIGQAALNEEMLELKQGQAELKQGQSELRQELAVLSQQMATVVQELSALRQAQAANSRLAPGSDAATADDPAEPAALPQIAVAPVVDASADSP